MSKENQKKYYQFEINLVILNVLCVVLLVFMIALVLFLEKNNIISYQNLSIEIAFLFYIPYMMLHEIIHGVAYRLNGADSKYITYGAHLEKSVLCCLCKQKISKKNILISLISPLIFIGFLTFIVGVLINNYVLIILSISNIAGCAGDIVMFFNFLTIKDFEYSECDGPTSFGLYTEQNLSDKKMFGLKYKGTTDKLEINDLKKIDCSKSNVILIGMMLISGMIMLIISI